MALPLQIFVFVLGLVWLIFAIAVIIAISKQNTANRLMLKQLDAIHLQMQQVVRRLETANRMHGDLNRAVQWFIDRQRSNDGAADRRPSPQTPERTVCHTESEAKPLYESGVVTGR